MRQSQVILPPLLLLLSLAFSSSQAEPTFNADQTLQLSQAGSTGGALGNEDKSVSGGQAPNMEKKSPKPRSVEKKALVRPEPTARPVSAPVRAPIVERAPPALPKPRPSPHPISLATYDGVYNGASTGPCIPRWSWSFRVVNGIMTGESGSNISGEVRPNGAAVGEMVVFGSAYNFSGHVTAAGVSGSWIKPGPGGCSGTWSATR
jgi:hypothetical protein